MSGMPIFADPSTKVVYQAVPPAGSSSRQGFVAVGHSQQPQPPQPPTMAMMMVQNNPQQQQQQQQHYSLSNLPLPPGMEIVLGDKKYIIQYQSYEMSREKATEYVAKCTGTPYSRMSSPPDPESMSSVIGSNRAEGMGEFSGATTSFKVSEDRSKRPRTPQTEAVQTGVTITGERGTKRTSLQTAAASEDEKQRHHLPDDIYTTTAPAASGLPPTIRGPLSQQQQQHLKASEHQGLTTDSSTYSPALAYPPLPLPRGTEQQQEQNLGYFWEDGVWKVWQANSSRDSADAVTDTAAKMPPPPPTVQQKQYSQPLQPAYASQLQAELPQYQNQYQYQYPHQQQQQLSIVATSTVHDPSPYVLPNSQHQQHHLSQPSQLRGPPPSGLPPGVINASGGNASAGTDPMVHRYMI